jgi:hypothetical protein
MGWVREPLDDAVRARRQVVAPPPATTTMGTPAHGAKGALPAQLREPNTVFMMGDNPALPRMPERPTLGDFFRLRFDSFSVAPVGAARNRHVWRQRAARGYQPWRMRGVRSKP